MIQIYTDGCCLNNQFRKNRGGWAFILVKNGEIIYSKHGKITVTTNQRMELMGCLEAMLFTVDMKEDIEIITDSAYIYNCVGDGWYLNWVNNGWENSKKEPVKNQDLWKPFVELLEKKYFKFIPVKGHSGNKYNERADYLARNAALYNMPVWEEE